MRKFLFFWEKYEVPDALPSELFPNDVENEYTWEQFYRETKAKHPVQYFFRKTLPHKFRVKIVMPIEHLFYFIRANTKDRYHILKLSNDAIPYKWGWVDAPQQMLYACMNIHKDFCEKEDGLKSLKYQFDGDWGGDWTEDQMADPREDAKKVYETALDIYNWWCKGGRRAEHDAVSEMFKKLPKKRPLSKCPGGEEWLESHRNLDKRDEEQLLRLIKIKDYLWT